MTYDSTLGLFEVTFEIANFRECCFVTFENLSKWGFEPWLPIHMGNVGKFTTTTSTLSSDRVGKYYSSEEM